jgi:hypothetical protein
VDGERDKDEKRDKEKVEVEVAVAVQVDSTRGDQYTYMELKEMFPSSASFSSSSRIAYLQSR